MANSILFLKWENELKKIFKTVKLQETQLPVRGIGGNWGTNSSVQVWTEDLYIAFVLDQFSGGCGVGTIYQYRIRSVSHETSYRPIPLTEQQIARAKEAFELLWPLVLTFSSRGAILACNPTENVGNDHFLRICEFTPLIGWGNPLHSNRALKVWIKILKESVDEPPVNLEKRELNSRETLVTSYKHEIETLKKKVSAI